MTDLFRRDYTWLLVRWSMLVAVVSLIGCNLIGIVFFFAAGGLDRGSKGWYVTVALLYGLNAVGGLMGRLLYAWGFDVDVSAGPLQATSGELQPWQVLTIVATTVLITLPPLLMLLTPETRLQRRIRRGERTLCPACGFDKRDALRLECPECGAVLKSLGRPSEGWT